MKKLNLNLTEIEYRILDERGKGAATIWATKIAYDPQPKAPATTLIYRWDKIIAIARYGLQPTGSLWGQTMKKLNLNLTEIAYRILDERGKGAATIWATKIAYDPQPKAPATTLIYSWDKIIAIARYGLQPTGATRPIPMSRRVKNAARNSRVNSRNARKNQTRSRVRESTPVEQASAESRHRQTRGFEAPAGGQNSATLTRRKGDHHLPCPKPFRG